MEIKDDEFICHVCDHVRKEEDMIAPEGNRQEMKCVFCENEE